MTVLLQLSFSPEISLMTIFLPNAIKHGNVIAGSAKTYISFLFYLPFVPSLAFSVRQRSYLRWCLFGMFGVASLGRVQVVINKNGSVSEAGRIEQAAPKCSIPADTDTQFCR